MPRSFAQIISMLVAILFLGACAQVRNVRVEPRLGFSEAPIVSHDYWKKGAITLKSQAKTEFERQAEHLLMQTVVQTIDQEAERFRLLPPDDNQFPVFLKKADPFSDPKAVFELLHEARRQGFHCLFQAALLDIRPVEKKKGIWWFRGTKYYLNVVVALDLYDPFTGAKISSQVKEALVKIRPLDYEDYMSGLAVNFEAVDDAIADMADEMGEVAVEQIESDQWMAVVVAVQGLQVRLAADTEAGLEPGDRFAVFEGRRVVDGLNGERFIVPGYKLADVEIVSVEGDGVTARSETPADIQPGDIAIPAE